MMEVEGSQRSLKRDHNSFEDLADLEEPCSVPANFLEMVESQREKDEPAPGSLPTPPVSIGTKRDPSPARSTTGSLTDIGTATSSNRGQSPMLGVPPSSTNLTSPSPSAFAALNGNAPPPAKKAKLTFAEKEARRIEKEFKDQQKAEEKARKEAERAAHAEEKARKEAEKEAERKKKEEEREAKRAAQEAEKTAKEEKRRKKEEEKQKAEEEKRKKERSQMRLGNFFNIPATARPRGASADSRGRSSMSPAPSSALAAASPAASASTPSKPAQTLYEKLFPDFFIQLNVTLAPFSRFERDEEAVESIQKSIDGYIHGSRSPGTQRFFDAQSLFHLSGVLPRGRGLMPVRDIMTEFHSGNASKPIDLTTDSQNSQIKRTGDLLQKIPMKLLHFREDVRPPYRGTYTSRPVTGMIKLARNPMRRDLPNTDYDYDSEAEWQEDEDAEDLKSEGDEDEEVDDDEDMDGFLDDENDETANSRRLVLQGDLEPISTGLCWEDRKKRNTNVKMVPYRMEVILGKFLITCANYLLTYPDRSIKSIDPFSKAYWEPVPTAMDPPRIPLNTMKTTSANFNGPTTTSKTVKPFFSTATDVLKSSPSTLLPPQSTLPSNPSPGRPSTKPAKDQKPKKLLGQDDMPAFCAAVQGSDLSKVGLIEVLKKKFPGRPAAAIKATLEAVAKREGVKEVDKRWKIVS
jgi:chromatin assembly factor 1 subunit A